MTHCIRVAETTSIMLPNMQLVCLMSVIWWYINTKAAPLNYVLCRQWKCSNIYFYNMHHHRSSRDSSSIFIITLNSKQRFLLRNERPDTIISYSYQHEHKLLWKSLPVTSFFKLLSLSGICEFNKHLSSKVPQILLRSLLH